MDGGLFSGQRSTGNRTAAPHRGEAAATKPVEEPHLPVERQRHVAPSHGHTKAKSPKRIIVPIVIILIVALLGLGAWFAFTKFSSNGAAAIDGNKYQAVFFTNGQVYFGKLSNVNDKYLKLTDIFYLQTKATDTDTSENPQKTTTDQNDVQLIKLGSEIHGPEDAMVISRDQVLFYENLKADGKVAQSIEQYKSSN